ncbi:MAG TPA: ATP phosphoribosyltransferase regulatory subunit, partial [Myxococcota bacterium]|nr:ATP phosphoribosyltransferase regulatory subunit [Myxococcota bacterium]
MASISPIKGFPEWLPPQRMVEQQLLDRIRRRYELFGYVPVETRAVEPIDYLASKGGDADKEIYVLRRLHADAEDRDGAGLGLHFDLTVPFARYVVQNRGRLSFPFRRYQIQKVWRGERPQDGRFREFYQCDADVIAPEKLSLQYDVEIAQLLFEVVSDLPVPAPTIQVNNRKILEGFYRALGVENITPTLRIVDKLDKIGPVAVRQLLQDQLGMSDEASAKVLQLSEIAGSGLGVLDQVRALGVQHPLLEEGLSELEFVLRGASDIPDGRLRANLKIARGLDYYTGIVFEGQLDGHEDLGSVCSGGRYENLAAALGSPVKLPGIGV